MAGSFSISLEQFAARTAQEAKSHCKKIATECFKRVIEKSPVDTGRFRANWGVSLNSPYTGTTDRKEPIEQYNRSGQTCYDAEWKVTSWNARGSIFLCNNLAYSVPLEYNHSTQFQGGMVRTTISEMQNGAAEQAVRS